MCGRCITTKPSGLVLSPTKLLKCINASPLLSTMAHGKVFCLFDMFCGAINVACPRNLITAHEG